MQWIDRLALPAALRLGVVLLGTAGRRAPWALAACAGGRGALDVPPLPARHARARDRLRDRGRRRPAARLHASPRRRVAAAHADCRGPARASADEDGGLA